MKVSFIGGCGSSSSSSIEATAIEVIPNNTLVHVYNDSGVLKVRIASNSTDYYANFFIKVGGGIGSKLKCFKDVSFATTAGITVGDIYLGSNGSFTNTAPISGSGLLSQHIGFNDGKTIIIDFSKPAVKLVSST